MQVRPPSRARIQLPLSFVLLAALLAAGAVLGIRVTKFYLLGVAALPLLACGVIQPQSLLTLAIALLPFTFSLTSSDQTTASSGMVGLSDVLFIIALPGLLFQALKRPANLKLGAMALPLALFLAVSLLSFYLNIPKMRELSVLSYFVGFLRTAQIVLVLPLSFVVIAWQPEDLRTMLRGFLYSSCFIAICGIIAFAIGYRQGLFVLGMQKNVVGLNLAVAVLVALAALTQPAQEAMTIPNRVTPPSPLGISRAFLITSVALCGLGLCLSLSRGAYICFLAGLLYLSIARKRGRVFAIVLSVALVALVGLYLVLPKDSAEYVTDLSAKSDATSTRLKQAELSMQEFRDNWLLGDGFRARRDFLPHNLEMTLLAENGLAGTALFLWVLIAQARLFHKGRQAFRQDPLREWVCVAIICCSVAILTQSQFDPFWRRGVLWIPWAGTGIVLSLLAQERQLQRQQRKLQLEEEQLRYMEQVAERKRKRRLRATTPTPLEKT